MKRFLLGLAIPFLIAFPPAGLCGEKIPGSSSGEIPEVSGKAEGPCRTLAAIVVVYPALEVTKSEGPIRDAPTGSGFSAGCQVHASGSVSAVEGEVAPEDAVQQLFEQDGWTEDPSYSADGPGTTSFALRKEGILCRISAGAPAGIEDGKFFTDEIYELDAVCTAE